MANIIKALEAIDTLRKEMMEQVPELDQVDLKLGIDPTNGKYLIKVVYLMSPRLTGLKTLRMPQMYKGFQLQVERASGGMDER